MRRVLAQVVADVLSTLAQPLVAVRHPGAALLQHAVFDRGVDQRAFARDALVEEDVEFGRTERRCDLVLPHLYLDPSPPRIEAGLDHLALSPVQAPPPVKLERPPPRPVPPVSHHDPDY